jgi:predicted nucleic acid-binding protein
VSDSPSDLARQKPKQLDVSRRIVTDLLIAAHALQYADRLLTRDRGFYRSRFAKLAVLDPTR